MHGVDVEDVDLTTREGNRLVVEAALERFGRSTRSPLTPASSMSLPSRTSLITSGTGSARYLTSPFLLAKYAWRAPSEHGDGRFVAMASPHSLTASLQGGLRLGKARRARPREDARARGRRAGNQRERGLPGYVPTPLVEAQIAEQAPRTLPAQRVLEEVILERQAVKRSSSRPRSRTPSPFSRPGGRASQARRS